MYNSTAGKNPKNGLYKPSLTPEDIVSFKKKPYVDPLKTKNYKDPLKEKKELVPKNSFKIPEYRPYNSYHEYQMPDIDPLTGKPRKWRGPRRQRTPPKEPQKPEGKIISPKKFGNSVGSISRTLRIQENLRF